MSTTFSFILVLGLLIFVHELGHFLFAKLCGVRVLKFSLGFGPRLCGRVVGDTEYVISAIPLGGYVKMYGENPDEQEAASAAQPTESFAGKKVWQRFIIVLAGPAFNFLFPLVLFFFLFLLQGIPESVDNTRVGKVVENSPAATAGMIVNDEIVEINGSAIKQWSDVLDGVKNSGGKKISIVVFRDGEKVRLEMTPREDSDKNVFGEEVERRYMIGVIRHDELRWVSTGPIGALEHAAQQTWGYTVLTVTGVVKIFQQVVPASELGGPILIAQLAGQHMRAGWIDFLYFMGLLSVNLGVLNLLPVPVLDGGHLMFLSIEAIRRKPMAERAQIIAQQIGIALLGTLMVFVFYNDIVRLFS